ncbi:hypothetical protein ACVILL_006474 [Bradyrhizobium sp. USDA 3364]
MRPKCRLVGKDLVLQRQEGAAGIHHVDARQIVLPRDVLGAQMLLHRHRVVGAALDGGVVGDDDAFAARDAADAGDDARRMHVAAIEAIGGERRQFQERGAGIDQEIDAVARQHLAARGVALARGLAAAAGHLAEFVAKLRDQAAHHLGVAGEFGRCGIDRRMKRHLGCNVSLEWPTGFAECEAIAQWRDGRREAQAVFANSSRPISMRRISLVPAPIS